MYIEYNAYLSIFKLSNFEIENNEIKKRELERYFIYYIHRLFDITYIEYFVRKLIWETVEFY